MRKVIDLSQVSFLVVDDSHFSRSMIRTVLRSMGVQQTNIHEAADGLDAMQALEIIDPDIAIIDYMMVPIDGIALTETIRRKEGAKFQTVPIIMLSAYSELGLIARARDAGVNEYVAKPVSVEALYLRIEEVICRPRQFVIAENFRGPDRHRHPDAKYRGPRRRKSDGTTAPAERPAEGPAETPGGTAPEAAPIPSPAEV